MNNDLISRSALLGKMECPDWYGTCCGVCHAIHNAPAVDAEPVRHGRWIPVELHKSFGVLKGVKCSMCGEEKVSKGSNYCPNCGAKMDLEE